MKIRGPEKINRKYRFVEKRKKIHLPISELKIIHQYDTENLHFWRKGLFLGINFFLDFKKLSKENTFFA